MITSDNLDIKRGDTKPDLVVFLTDNGTPIDLTNAQQIRVILSKNGSGPLISKIVNGNSSGQVTMLWDPSDTANTLVYQGEVEVTWPDDSVQTWPARGFFTVTITEDLR